MGLDRAYERMTAVAVAALHEREPALLWPILAGALADLCGGEAVVHKLDEWSEREGTIGVAPDAAAAELERLGDADLALLRAGYPLAQHYADRTDRMPATAHRAVGRAWPDSPTARLLNDVWDVDHMLGVPLPDSTSPVTGCLVYRAGTDFTDDQLAMAERAQPLLAAVERQRQLLEEWRRVLGPAGAPDERAADAALTPREATVLLLLTDSLTADASASRSARCTSTSRTSTASWAPATAWAPYCGPSDSAWCRRPVPPEPGLALRDSLPWAGPHPQSSRPEGLSANLSRDRPTVPQTANRKPQTANRKPQTV